MASSNVKAYAQALLAQIKTKAQLTSWLDFIKSLESLWDEHNKLFSFWARLPYQTALYKARLLTKAVLKKKNESKERFVKLILERKFWPYLPSLRAELLKLYDDNHHRGCLRIASSRPLESDQEKAIIARFQKHFPEKSFYVEYHMLNEPGITAQFKDYLLDLRVTHRLHRIKNKILQG